MVGVVVHFDEQAIRTGSHGSASHGWNFVAAASAVRRIGNHREMREFLDDGDSSDVERVPRVSLESADATLAKDYVVVAASEDVFGTEQELFHGGRHAPL